MGLRMMVVVAHPDDECFAFGGAIALATRKGIEVSCICLTDGQAASSRGNSTDAQDLGRIRREEFAASCAILGVQHHELLDYQDAQLIHADIQEAAKKVVQRLRTFKPHVVLTFGLDGGLNLHSDHAMVSAISSMAYHWAGRPKHFPELELPPHLAQRLFHVTTSFTLPEREALMPSPWTCVLDTSDVLAQRMDAFKAHASQQPVMDTAMAFIDKFEKEYYLLVATTPPQAATQITDIFDGVTE